jgi:hypothetical protein
VSQLFAAVYGTPDHHRLVRERCLQYIVSVLRVSDSRPVFMLRCCASSDERTVLLQELHRGTVRAIRGTHEGTLALCIIDVVTNSSAQNDGEWGDHVEIQAMSEIYDRPVHIYAYSSSESLCVAFAVADSLLCRAHENL